jgi:glycine oxidase
MLAKGALMEADVIVVGGGVIGTAIAWRAARAGHEVIQVDPGGDDPGTDDKASLVAAGMLGPVSESVFGERDLLNLNLHAIDRFPSFNRELEAATGQYTGLRTEGTLAVAYDNGDLAALDRLTDFRHSIGLKAERLDARECRRLEPFLAPGTRGGVLAAGDLSVDNRRYLSASSSLSWSRSTLAASKSSASRAASFRARTWLSCSCVSASSARVTWRACPRSRFAC